MAGLTRNGAVLAFHGALERAAVATLWRQALPLLDGARSFDLSAVERVDSAGLALLAELAQRSGGATLAGQPPGLAELATAYRLDAALGYAR